MTTDSGMDVSPSWQELKEERDSLDERLEAAYRSLGISNDTIAEQDKDIAALAAHVERLTGTIEFLLDTGEWSSHTTVSQMAKGDISSAPTASLDRLKGEWQVDGAVLVGALLVDKYESNFPGGEDEILQICDYALRRQAEEPRS